MNKKLAFDSVNCRVVTEDDLTNVFYTDTLVGDFTCAASSIQMVVDMHNDGYSLSEIDDFLLNDVGSTQEAREFIVEALYDFLYRTHTIVSPYSESIPFYGEPIHHKIDGVYGCLAVINERVFFFSVLGEGDLTFSVLEEWTAVPQPKA